MATATAYSSVDMEFAQVWYGTVTIATSTHIRVEDGPYIQNYYGTGITYSGDSVTGGTITATDYYEFGSKVYGITGGAYNAVTIANYINNDDMQGLLSYVFAGNDVINGSSQSDYLIGYAGNDTMNGGGGDDYFKVDNASDVVNETTGAGYDWVEAYVNYTLTANIEVLDLYGAATVGTGNELDNDIYGNEFLASTIYGLAGDDWLSGYNGNDSLYGGDGDDVLDGGLGADRLDGGAGSFDTVSYSYASSGVAADLNQGGYSGEATGDTYVSIEGVDGSNYDDVIVGIAGQSNGLYGNSGNDSLYGDGLDFIDGGDGNDVFFGGQGSALNMTSITNVETIWASYGSDNLDGSSSGSSLTLIGQGPTADILRGGFGSDFIYFRNGDTVSGGTLTGTTDWAVATLSSTGVTLDLAATGFEAAWGSSSNDTLISDGSGTAVLVGDAGDDYLEGGSGVDFLYGFGGADTLRGDGGNDVLIGDGHGGTGGSDTFAFSFASQFLSGTDQIFYFVSGEDKLQFNSSLDNDWGITAGSALNSQNFISGAAPTSVLATPTFLYNTTNGLLTFDADGTGSGAGYFVAQFFLAAPVAAADFVFV